MTIEKTIERLKRDWSEPRSPLNSDHSLSDFSLACTFAESCVSGEDWKRAVSVIPHDLRTFWKRSECAKLFEDVKYGQWGLEILNGAEAARETNEQHSCRSNDFERGDLVVGRFLGDSDLLLVRCDSNANDFGSVIVALPLDPRQDWDRVADSFEDFLETYASAAGEKYWER